MMDRDTSRTQTTSNAAARGKSPSALQIELARRIVSYMRRCRTSEGDHLTAQELAHEFNVSRSPIFGALAYLADKGVFERWTNRGYFVKVSHDALDLDGLSIPETDEDRQLDVIMRDWVENKTPQTFTVAAFRRRYGLGWLAAPRTLAKLAYYGIVTSTHRHRWQFESALNTMERRDESYSLRIVVEPAAIRTTTFELDRGLAAITRDQHEAALSSPPEHVTFATLTRIDVEFHHLIGVSSRNQYFLETIERQNAWRAATKHFSRDRGRGLESCAEHMAILDAIEHGEREAAADLMRHHLQSAQGFNPWGGAGQDHFTLRSKDRYR